MPEEAGFDVSAIPRREPVLLGGRENFPSEKVSSEWLLVTERVKRDLLSDQTVRNSLYPFTTTPVSETLPLQAIEALSAVDSDVQKLAVRYDPVLGKYLKLPPVPDDALVPDISNSSNYRTPEDIIKIYPDNSRYAREDVEHIQAQGGFTSKTTTKAEKALVAARYKMARDVKLLAFGAELADQPKPPTLDNFRAELPSGIKITVAKDHLNEAPVLLDPLNWEKRKQIKDRVYEIAAGGKKYILKERKTHRHTDTHEHGHVVTNTSGTEGNVGLELKRSGHRSEGNISVSWEKPVGYVAFPDGFQFTLFENESDLLDETDAGYKISDDMIAHPELYGDEYEELKKRVTKEPDEPQKPTGFRRLLPRFGGGPVGEQFTFTNFMQIKINYMLRRSKELYKQALLDNLYTNSDHDGYLFKVEKKDGEAMALEIFGFDFEYVKKHPKEYIDGVRERIAQIDVAQREQKATWLLRQGFGQSMSQKMLQEAYWGYYSMQEEKRASAELPLLPQGSE